LRDVLVNKSNIINILVEAILKDLRSETKKHIKKVEEMLHIVIKELVLRSINHDKSKLESPEREKLDEYVPKLKSSTYGSEQYNQFLKDLKPILDLHYKKNRHHPEHFKDVYDEDGKWNPLAGMNLIDLIEMFCDWKAATLRHDDGDLNNSIEINKKRFNISNQITSIFQNSVDLFK
jgi:hypothetical protein